MANNVKYVIDEGKNKFAAYDAESVDSLLNEKVNNDAFNSAVEELEGEIEQKANTEYVNEEIARIETIIEDLPEPMIFKGTLGTGGTIQDLPTASASNEGFTYKVITAGTYAGQSARVGDVFISNGSEWVLVPAGDDFNDTWRAIKVNGTEVLNNAISSGAVNFNEGDQLTITFDAETKTLNFNVVNTYTKQEVDDIIYNVLPDGTANGAVANFNTSLQLPIKSMQIDVNAKQDLHGYGYPWFAGGGKNLLLSENGEYKTTTGNNIYIVSSEDNFVLPAGTYFVKYFRSTTTTTTVGLYISIDGGSATRIGGNASEQTATRSFTLETDSPIVLRLYSSTAGFNGNGYRFMLAKTDITNDDYSPYENICPIEGVGNIQFINCEKNIFNYDENKVKTGTTTTHTIRSYYDLGVKNITLTFSAKLKDGEASTPNDYLNIGFFDSNNGLLNIQRQFITPESIMSQTLVFSSTETAVLVSLENPNVIKSILNRYLLQIEVGTSSSTIEIFNGTIQIISLGGTYYGGKLTQDKDGHRQFEVTHNILILTEENINIISRVNADKYRVFNANCGAKITGADYADIICNILKSQTGITNDGRCYINANGDIRMNFTKEYNTVAEMIADMKNIQLCFPVDLPFIVNLPDGEPINTFNGINNFFADSGDTTVIFKQSVNDAINAAVNAANNNRMLGMINMSKGNESEEKEETKEDLTEESNEK